MITYNDRHAGNKSDVRMSVSSVHTKQHKNVSKFTQTREFKALSVAMEENEVNIQHHREKLLLQQVLIVYNSY